MSESNGAIIYQGPSLLDGAPIVVVAVGLNVSSKNRKTGGMIQTHILRADIPPMEAIHTGADISICGNCPARGDGTGKDRTCYVVVAQGPTVVWKTYKAGKYPVATSLQSLGANRLVRIGTYGDPAAVPMQVWDEMLSDALGHTGYSHQWRTTPELRQYCMASVDNEQEAREAQLMGWRTFRVAFPGDVLRFNNESICPASKEAGKKLTCDKCLACDGANGRRGSIVIQAHGGTAVMANVNRKVA